MSKSFKVGAAALIATMLIGAAAAEARVSVGARSVSSFSARSYSAPRVTSTPRVTTTQRPVTRPAPVTPRTSTSTTTVHNSGSGLGTIIMGTMIGSWLGNSLASQGNQSQPTGEAKTPSLTTSPSDNAPVSPLTILFGIGAFGAAGWALFRFFKR